MLSRTFEFSMPSPSLSNLPSEIRLLIWEHLGLRKAICNIQICEFGICNTSADILNILQVNKQIREETLSILDIEVLQINVPLTLSSTQPWQFSGFMKKWLPVIKDVVIAPLGDDLDDYETVISFWPATCILEQMRSLIFSMPEVRCLQIDQDFATQEIMGWKETLEGDHWTVNVTPQPHQNYSFGSFERRAKGLMVKMGLPLHGFDRFSYTVRINNKSEMRKLRMRISFKNTSLNGPAKAGASV